MSKGLLILDQQEKDHIFVRCNDFFFNNLHMIEYWDSMEATDRQIFSASVNNSSLAIKRELEKKVQEQEMGVVIEEEPDLEN